MQSLLFLGTVVCSMSAPTSQSKNVTSPGKHVNAIKEARSILNHCNDSAAIPVSEGRPWLCLGHLSAPHWP